MVVYDDLYVGSDLTMASRINYLSVLSSLNMAKKESEKFVLMSRSSVFDLSIDRGYSEKDVPNSHDKCMTFLSEAEKAVLEYENGYVFRSHHIISHYYEAIKRMVHFEGVPSLKSESIYPLSDEAYHFLVAYYDTNAKERHVIHISSPSAIESFELWFLTRGMLEYTIDEENPRISLGSTPGRITPSVLLSEKFSVRFLAENMKCIRHTLKSIGGI